MNAHSENIIYADIVLEFSAYSHITCQPQIMWYSIEHFSIPTDTSSLDSFTRLEYFLFIIMFEQINSSNFKARFRKKFRPNIWPCLVFS